MGRFIFISILLMVGVNFAHAEICFDSEEQYNQVKEKLPPILQSPPLYFGSQGFKANVAAQIFLVEGKLKFDLFAATIIGAKKISNYVHICVQENTVTLSYDNDKKEKIEITSAATIDVKGVSLGKLATHAQYADAQAKVARRDKSIKIPTAPESPAPGVGQ